MPDEHAPGEASQPEDALTETQEKQLKKLFRECIREFRKEEREEHAKAEEEKQKLREQEEAERKAAEPAKPSLVRRGLFYKKR